MSTEQTTALVRPYFDECVSQASGPGQRQALAIVDELLTDDFVMRYNTADAEATRGRQGHKEFLVAHAGNFPNDSWTIEALIADEETAGCHWRIQAIYAPTGNPIDVRARGLLSNPWRQTG